MADNTINPGSGLQGDPSSSKDFINAEDLGIDMEKLGPMDSGFAFTSIDEEPEDKSVSFDFVVDPTAAGVLDQDKAISNEDQYLIDDYAEKLGTRGVFGINSGMMQAMAERQSVSEQLGRATMRLSTIPFNIIGSVANMADLEDYFNSDAEMGNWVSDLMTEITDDINKSTGIYRKNPGKAFDLTDSGWWLENGSGLVNSMSEFVALGAATGGVGGAARFLTGLKKLSDGTKLARGFDALVSSGMLNQAESMKSAAEIYKSTRAKALEQGRSAQEANQIAADAAAHSVNLQRMNIAVNMTSAGRFLKPAATTRGALNKALESGKKQFGREILTEAPQEYIEENINLIGEAEGNRLAEALLADKKYEWNLENTVGDVASLEGLEAGVLGMVGAIGQTGGTKLINKVPYKKRGKVDAEGNAVYTEKGSLAYINQDAVDAVNNLYKTKLEGKSDLKSEYKATPLAKAGKQLGWIVQDGDQKVTVNKDDEVLKAKYGIEQENKGTLSQITEEELSQATGIPIGDDRLKRLMKIHKKVVENNLTSINDPKLRGQKELDVSEKKQDKEWYSLSAESKEKQAKLQEEFDKLNAEMEKTGISATDVMSSAKEQIKFQNELNLIDVLSDPRVYQSTPKRQAIIDKMKAYAESELEGDAKKEFLNKIHALDKATVEELGEMQEEAKSRLLSSQVKQHAAIGAIDKLEELYTKVKNLSPEEASERGYDAEYKSRADEALRKIKEYEKVYQSVAGRFGKEIDAALFDTKIERDALAKKKAVIDRKVELAKAREDLDNNKKLNELGYDGLDRIADESLTDLMIEQNAINNRLAEKNDLMKSLKTNAGQVEYFTKQSTPQKAFERKRLVHNKLIELFENQRKPEDERDVYFYRDEPVILEPVEDEASPFGYSFVLKGMDGEVIQKVDERGLKILIENTKSQKEFKTYIENEEKAAIAKANADAIKEVTDQVAKDSKAIDNEIAAMTKKITDAATTISDLTNAGISNVVTLETKFKDGSVREDSYRYDPRTNSIINVKNNKRLFGQSPLRSRLEKEFAEQFADARRTVETNNAAIDKLEESVEGYKEILAGLQVKEESLNTFTEMMRKKDDMLRGADESFVTMFENALNEMQGSMGGSIENLTKQTEELGATKAKLEQSIDKLEDLLKAAKIENADLLTQNSIEVALIRQKRKLEPIKQRFDRFNEEVKKYAENAEIAQLFRAMNSFALKAQEEARKAKEKTQKELGSSNEPTPGSNPEPVSYDEADFEKANNARKMSAYTTAGNDLQDPSEESKRWYRALNKLGEKSARQYRIEFITREEAVRRIPENEAYATVFSRENEIFEIYEHDSNNKPILDENGNMIKRATPFQGLRAVLIYPNGELVRATSDGSISKVKGTLALSTYMHNPDGKTLVFKDENGNLQSKMSVPHIVREHPNFRQDNGKPYALSTIRGWLASTQEVNAPGGPYKNGTEFQNELLQEVYDNLHNYRGRIFAKIKDGERAIANIEGLSGGHPIRAPRNFEGNRIENKPSEVFAQGRNLKSMTVTPRGEVLVEDFKGRRLDLNPRLLTETEVTKVQLILDKALNDMSEAGVVSKFKVENSKQQYTVFPFKSPDAYSVIEQYIYWGKAKDGKNADYQIFYDKDTRRLHFGAEESIPFSEIMTSEALKTFLSSKRLNFNKTINAKIKKSGKKDSPYSMIDLSTDGKVSLKTFKGDGNLSGYENYIYQNYTTDLVESTEERPNFAQRSIKFSNTLTELTEAIPEVEEEVEETTESTEEPTVKSEIKKDNKENVNTSTKSASSAVNLVNAAKNAKAENKIDDSGKSQAPVVDDNGFVDLTGGAGGTTTEGDVTVTAEVSDGKGGTKTVTTTGKKKTLNVTGDERTAKKYFKAFQQQFKNNEAESSFKDFDDFKKFIGEDQLAEFVARVEANGGITAISEELAIAVSEGFIGDIDSLLDPDGLTGMEEFFKLTPVQTVKLHNFISANARKFQAKGLSLDPAVYEAEMRSIKGNVDTFINILENYLNC